MEQSVKLISLTQGAGELLNKNAQEIIAFTARVSNPKNQMNFETAPKLLKYLIKHKHWSPFEMISIGMEIITSRGIGPQLLRHTFKFQEFSQRYSEVTDFITITPRRQDGKNKQNSIDDLSEENKAWFSGAMAFIENGAQTFYKEALERGVAKECARFMLPLSSATTMYVHGPLRTWIHWCEVRCAESTQLEHREIALSAKKILIENFPDVAEALEWK
jgi:thymidylate synthase (FAD)